MSALLRRVVLMPRTPAIYRSWSTTPAPSEAEFQDNVPMLSDEEAEERMRKIERSRNKSRLSPQHYNIIHGVRPYDKPMIKAHITVKYHRKMFGNYGFEAGVDPSLCWPSREELDEAKEYERVAHPFTIQEMVAEATRKKQEEKRAIQEREDSIALKMQKLQLWKKDLNDKIAKKMQESRAAKEKKERLVEEVRRHFGFKLDHRDERFQEMLAKRKKEQKKIDKLAKREAKEKEMLAKIQMKNTALEMQTNKTQT